MPIRPEVPEGNTPTTGQIIAYAGVGDVEAMNRGRKIGEGANPTKKDVEFFLEVVAAEIDGILIDKGYQLPIPSTATGALQMLRRVNAQGAILEVELASPSSQHAERFQKTYDESIEMLKTADLVMNVPKSDGRSKPRGPGLTVAPGVLTNAEYERQEREEQNGLIGESLGKSAPFFRRNMPF